MSTPEAPIGAPITDIANQLTQRLAVARGGQSGTLLDRLRARQQSEGRKTDFSHLDDPGFWSRIGCRPARCDDTEADDIEPVIVPRATRKPPSDPDGLLTMAEAAARLNITSEQCKAFVDDGALRYVNLGRGATKPRYRFKPSDLDDFISDRTTLEQPLCPSSSPKRANRTTGTASRSNVVGFTALRAARLAKKPNGSRR